MTVGNDGLAPVTGNASTIGVVPTVLAGWAEFGGTGTARRARHFFSCPFGEQACPAVRIDANATRCAPGYRGTLCGECEAGWAQTPRGCTRCKVRAAPK